MSALTISTGGMRSVDRAFAALDEAERNKRLDAAIYFACGRVVLSDDCGYDFAEHERLSRQSQASERALDIERAVACDIVRSEIEIARFVARAVTQ